MRKEITADFDDVQKHLRDGWTVEIGGDPVIANDIADRTAVCTKPDEPVKGHAHLYDTQPGSDRLLVYVSPGEGRHFEGQLVEIRLVEP